MSKAEGKKTDKASKKAKDQEQEETKKKNQDSDEAPEGSEEEKEEKKQPKKHKSKKKAAKEDDDAPAESKSDDDGDKKPKKKKNGKHKKGEKEKEEPEKEEEAVGVMVIDPDKPLDEQLIKSDWLAELPKNVLALKGAKKGLPEKIGNSRSNNVVLIEDCDTAEVIVVQNQRFAALYFVNCVDCKFQVGLYLIAQMNSYILARFWTVRLSRLGLCA